MDRRDTDMSAQLQATETVEALETRLKVLKQQQYPAEIERLVAEVRTAAAFYGVKPRAVLDDCAAKFRKNRLVPIDVVTTAMTGTEGATRTT
jgi:hypothetical protein